MEQALTLQREVYKTPELMTLTGKGRDGIRALVREGKLRSIGGTRKILVPRASLEQFLTGEVQK